MRGSLHLSIIKRENNISFVNKMFYVQGTERTDRNCLTLFLHAAISQVEVYY